MAGLITLTDEQGQIIGSSTMRAAMELGDIRLIVRVVLRNSRNEYLLQQRSEGMITFPGYWDVSAAGHVDVGETPYQAAYRELQEELGLDGVELTEKAEYYIESIDRGRLLRQYTHVFDGRFDGKVSDLSMEDSEVSSVRWIDSESLSSLNPVMKEAIQAIGVL